MALRTRSLSRASRSAIRIRNSTPNELVSPGAQRFFDACRVTVRRDPRVALHYGAHSERKPQHEAGRVPLAMLEADRATMRFQDAPAHVQAQTGSLHDCSTTAL